MIFRNQYIQQWTWILPLFSYRIYGTFLSKLWDKNGGHRTCFRAAESAHRGGLRQQPIRGPALLHSLRFLRKYWGEFQNCMHACAWKSGRKHWKIQSYGINNKILQQADCTMASFYYYGHNPFSLFFSSLNFLIPARFKWQEPRFAQELKQNTEGFWS